MIKLETERLSTSTIVRPAGTLGTCGWHPKAWQASIVKRGESPVIAFLRNNTNWTQSEVQS